MSNEEHCRLGRWRENEYKKQRRCDGQVTRGWTRSLAPLHSRLARVEDRDQKRRESRNQQRSDSSPMRIFQGKAKRMNAGGVVEVTQPTS
ncbi:hypothetical protein TNCV_3015431 [Trichonephila clavipes]|nr:hypothetical protein TNCV_3015431 [Trichonephila clavipes]